MFTTDKSLVGLNVVKCCFLLYILFFNQVLWAQPDAQEITATQAQPSSNDSIKLNLDPDSKDLFNPSDSYTQTLERMNGDLSNGLETKSVWSMQGTGASQTLIFGLPTCSFQTPNRCLYYAACRRVNGYWDFIANTCSRADCHIGTIEDVTNPGRCRCTSSLGASSVFSLDNSFYVDRGDYLQSCPSSCRSAENEIYSLYARACVCEEGFTRDVNGKCVANQITAASGTTQRGVAANDNSPNCWGELEAKVSSCESAASGATNQCDPDGGDSDSLALMEKLLFSSNSGASQNCEKAATASTSGYHTTDSARAKCDETINTCRTNCTDAAKYMNDNKERLYNACRERAMQAQVNEGPPLPADRFNPMWDAENRSQVESQFQALLSRANGSRTTCETGEAAKNRNKLSDSMNDLSNTSKAAAQCACQLNPNSADCSKQVVGPLDCVKDPSLAGCKSIADNCFDKSNNSLKCICFRDPGSAECKGKFPSNMAAGVNFKDSGNQSGFAGGRKGTEVTGGVTGESGTGGVETTGIGKINVGDGIKEAEVSTVSVPGASESPSSSAGSAGAGAAPSAAAGSGGAGKRALPQAPAGDATIAKKLTGFFNNAKMAIGGVFKKVTDKENSAGETYRDVGQPAQQIDVRRFRPRGTVRGIASDQTLAGKHDDIWKVMSKQYKVQDQKDKFIFDQAN